MSGSKSNYWDRQVVTRRRWIGGAAAAGVGATSLALVGCGDDDDDDGASTPETAAPGTAAATSVVEGKPGGTLRVAMDRDPVSFDPHIEASYRTQWAVGSSYNRVLSLSSDLQIGPELAASREQPDPTTLTLKLQPGVKFHDMAPVSGRALTAEDIIWSIERIRTNKPEFQRRYMFEGITSMTAPDANTVVIKLGSPFAPLLAYLANPFTVVAPKEAAAASGDLRTVAIGTGPFMLKESKKGVSYTSVRNPNYWQAKRPYLDGLSLLVVPDEASRASSLRAKQLDLETILPDAAESLRKESSMTVSQAGLGSSYSFRFNTTKPPFNDVRVRKALDLILARKQFIDLTAAGVGLPTGPVSPGLAAWALPSQELATRPGYRAAKDQDIAEAKRLLSAAGASGNEFELLFYTPANIHEQLAVVAQEQLQAAGVKVKLNKQDYAAWIPLMLEKNFQFTVAGGGFRDNPDEYVYALFHSKSSRNDTGFAAMDAVLERQRTMLDEPERKKLVLDIQNQLLEQVPNAWLFAEQELEARYNYIKGYSLTYPHNRTRQFGDMWFDA